MLFIKFRNWRVVAILVILSIAVFVGGCSDVLDKSKNPVSEDSQALGPLQEFSEQYNQGSFSEGIDNSQEKDEQSITDCPELPLAPPPGVSIEEIRRYLETKTDVPPGITCS